MFDHSTKLERLARDKRAVSMTTLSILTVSVKGLFVTLGIMTVSITGLFVTLSIMALSTKDLSVTKHNDSQHERLICDKHNDS